MIYQKNQIETITYGILQKSKQLNREYIDILGIAESFDLVVYEVVFDDKNISSMVDYGNKTISIERRESEERKRFLIAKQIGHFVLHHMLSDNKNEGVVSYKSSIPSSKYEIKESEAEHFAVSILMPRDIIEVYWKDCKSVDVLSKVFSVTPSALCKRLEYLDLETK